MDLLSKLSSNIVVRCVKNERGMGEMLPSWNCGDLEGFARDCRV